jgi:hypothetical protein
VIGYSLEVPSHFLAQEFDLAASEDRIFDEIAGKA